ncbi:MAG: acyl-CoA dehydrogenase family protein [Gammaproteobacteria bacterium]|nr:acyl-CoA dehydrogenase family protein [Gammaproteobacteria bacterium]
MSSGPYLYNERHSHFLLWEQFPLDEILSCSSSIDKETAIAFLDLAKRFSIEELSKSYQSADRVGCTRLSDQIIKIPSEFESLWEKYQSLGFGQMAATDENGESAPYLLLHAICEMLFGSNPSFMMYSGFGVPMAKLIKTFGNEYLNTTFYQPLIETKWCGAFCVTEANAGSDVSGLSTRATKIEEGVYKINGEKIFITAGMHQLTDNMVYLVLARTDSDKKGALGLSCFLVPKFDVETGVDNHIRCGRIENKMGLHGCATTSLIFGEAGETKGYLLGKENQGLRQLRSLMSLARVSTGVFALGMSSSAYLNALEYAKQRVQGVAAGQVANAQAKKVAIIQHLDVKRMLMEMRCITEGCRSLLYKFSYHFSIRELYEKGRVELDSKEAFRHKGLADLLVPLVKAYISDQAWKVSELAIQVYGGHGYIKDNPLEQYARDIKILSIWEGTNYIQSADLIREKLAMGKHSKLMKLFINDIQETIDKLGGDYLDEKRSLKSSLDCVINVHFTFGSWVDEGEADLVFSYSTRFLSMISEVWIYKLMLDACLIMKNKTTDPEGNKRYESERLKAQFYEFNILPNVMKNHNVILLRDRSLKSITVESFEY